MIVAGSPWTAYRVDTQARPLMVWNHSDVQRACQAARGQLTVAYRPAAGGAICDRRFAFSISSMSPSSTASVLDVS